MTVRHGRVRTNTYVYKLEMSTGPKFPAQPAKFFSAQLGPESMYYINQVYYNSFEILHQNRYNYIKLHSHFRSFKYCTTALVQLQCTVLISYKCTVVQLYICTVCTCNA